MAGKETGKKMCVYTECGQNEKKLDLLIFW